MITPPTLTSETVHVFKVRMVNGACLTMAINGWNFLVQVYYIPSFYQLVYGYSAVKSASLLLPITMMQSKSTSSTVLKRPFLTTSNSRHEHHIRLNRPLDRSISRMHPLRLGLLGHRPRPLLHPRREFRSGKTNRICHPHRNRLRQHSPTRISSRPSRGRTQRHGSRDLISEFRPELRRDHRVGSRGIDHQ